MIKISYFTMNRKNHDDSLELIRKFKQNKQIDPDTHDMLKAS